MKKALIISPQFAPVNSADSHRVRQILPYLKDNGWYAEIVTVCIDRLEKPVIDQRLLNTIPVDLIVHFVGAFNYQKTRKIGLGSLSIRSFFHYYRFLNKLLKKKRFDLIFFSTTSFHLLALGPIMKRKFNIPYVLDIQDPWRSDFYLDRPKKERPPKFMFNYIIDKYLESFALPKADGIISVSSKYLEVFKNRYKELTINQKEIPFSATCLDYTISQNYPKHQQNNKDQEIVKIVYVGRGGYDLSFAISCFLKAVKKLEDSSKQIYDCLAISFIGTSYAPRGEGKETIAPIARKLGLDRIVIEKTDRVGYFEAIQLIQHADILFVPGSIDEAYTASKIYPYILADKPLLACFHENSSVVRILKECSKAKVVSFTSLSTESSIVQALSSELNTILETYKSENFKHNEHAMEKYMAPAMTRNVCNVFNSAL